MHDLELNTLTRDSASFAKLDGIFAEAFPPEEVFIPFEEYVALSERLDCVRALEIADGDKPIGLFLYADSDEYSYLNFFAVDASERGQGYGQRALTQLLDFFGDKALVADIECPIEGEEDYEIKLRRQKFYERNGFVTSTEPYEWDGDKYLVISNRTDHLNPELIFNMKDVVKAALDKAE